MDSPLVSVIIPNYNQARFLDERIQTVLNQTYQNFEVIILDDKSTDNSVEVINKYKDNPHVSHIVVNEENSGSPFKQWHKGFELSKGKWIWIAESDDSCKPGFLETLTRHIDDNTSFIFCRSKRISFKGEYIEESWQDELKCSFSVDGKQFIKDYLSRKCIVWNASSVIFRRTYTFQIPQDYTKYRTAGDWLFWIFLSCLGKVSFINTPLNYFRLHGNNTTQQSFQSGLAEEEKINLYNYLVSGNYISKQCYREIRKNDIYRVFIYNTFDKETTDKILNKWHVSATERYLVWFKKQYIRMINSL